MSDISKEILKDYIKDQNFTSTNDILASAKDMFRNILQEALESELTSQLGYDKYDVSEKQTLNSRNGHSKKTVKSELGTIVLNIPRDRKGKFESKILPKYQRNITGIEDKILALYAIGMTTRSVAEQIKNLYDVKISAETVSNISNKIIPVPIP
ncbi:transposase [Clostridium tagluense]|uniref:transposase n=1 Tax=Clostridium tagluense TaxID=360422 RepID=UPI001CF55484|nr:transposase [Clostridium tagluense]MCB2298182.1 transposase [Clostridium tagluense]